MKLEFLYKHQQGGMMFKKILSYLGREFSVKDTSVYLA